jgi:amino acid transporter
MKILGFIIIIISIIIFIWGVRQTNAVHDHNMEYYSETAKNDVPFIIIGILGGLLSVVGFVMMLQPAKRRAP